MLRGKARTAQRVCGCITPQSCGVGSLQQDGEGTAGCGYGVTLLAFTPMHVLCGLAGTAASTAQPAWSSASSRASGSATRASPARPPASSPTWRAPGPAWCTRAGCALDLHALPPSWLRWAAWPGLCPASGRLPAVAFDSCPLSFPAAALAAGQAPGQPCLRPVRAHRQVKARVRECQLHRDSPLGDALLECYACGSRNAFALGFVPVRSRVVTDESVFGVLRHVCLSCTGG